MTEEQKKEFINWLDRVVGLTKAFKDIENLDVKGLSEYAGVCGASDTVHLNNEAFKYAVECLNPEINEKIVEYRNETYKNRRLSFIYRNTEILSLFKMED